MKRPWPKRLLCIVTALAVGMMLGVFVCSALTQDVILVETEHTGTFSVPLEPALSPTAIPVSAPAEPSISPEPRQLQQPEPPDETVSTAEIAPEPSENSGSMDLNTATAQELETLPGIGPVLAQRFVDYREENGGFRVVEELLDVKGIGEKTFAKIADYVEVRK